MPEVGWIWLGLRFQSAAGVEWRRFEIGVERVVRRINGVKPDDSDSVCKEDPGSEKRTRFFALLGVAGGVDIPWGRGAVAVLELERKRELSAALLRLFLRRDIGRSSTSGFDTFMSAIIKV